MAPIAQNGPFWPQKCCFLARNLFFVDILHFFCYHHDGTPKRQHFCVDHVAGQTPGGIQGSVFGPKICLWPQKGHLWPFWAILRPYGAPRWPFRTREMVPTHPLGCVLPWSNLDPRWSTISEPPDLLMARSAIYGTFWTVFGHKMGQNGWIKNGCLWIKTFLNPMDQIHVLVFTKCQLWISPPP